MNKPKFISLVLVIVALIVCVIPVGCIGNKFACRAQIETEAKNKLEAALKTMPIIPGDVLVQTASGRTIGGTMGCVSYSIEQVHATNELSFPEVLSVYSSTLPLAGWKPDLVVEKALTFDFVGDVRLDVGELGEVYWFYLYPFNDPFSSQATIPNKGAIKQAKEQFKTIFALSIITYPPDNEKCRGG